MKKGLFFFVLLIIAASITAQPVSDSDSAFLINLNQQIDTKVVAQDSTGLKDLYADDFVFSHGSGRVDNKQSWLRSVAKGGFLIRRHDSVTVEAHPGLALVKGRLSVEKKNKDKTDRYFLKYIRLYAVRNKLWQLVSHITIFEQHTN